MRLPKTYRSDEEARQAGRLLEEDRWHPARITKAEQKRNKYGKDEIELSVLVGGSKALLYWITGSEKAAACVRSCFKAVNALDAYESGEEISASLFPDHDCEVRLIIEKGQRGSFPDRNRIIEFRAVAASPSVINLRSA